MTLSSSTHHHSAAYTLIETNAATLLVSTFIAGIMAMDSNLFGLIKNAKDNASANQALQERVEQMRISNWVQITDANYIATTLLNAATSSSVGLAAPVETLTVSAYPVKAIAPAKVTRTGSTVAVNSVDGALQGEKMVRVDLKLSWQTGSDKRVRTRATSVLIAKGGVTK